jgi:hypothetical protein
MSHSSTKAELEYLRYQAKQRFDKVRGTWIDACKWALPHRNNWLLAQTEGQRKNQHIVDSTHILALRSYVAGFLEGNTSAGRPWFRIGTSDPDRDMIPANHVWLEKFTRLCLKTLFNSNFYHAAGAFYYDYGVVNTASYYVEEVDNDLFFHTLMPGSYFVINNTYGDAVIMVREWALPVKAVVDAYGKKTDGKADWSNISATTKRLYEQGNYTQMVDIVQCIKENDQYDPNEAQDLLNRKWVSYTYELAGNYGQYYQQGGDNTVGVPDAAEAVKFLKVSASQRKPFIVGRSTTSNNFEYGEKGPTTDSLGLIKSLNKKAIGKDQALEQMLRPAMQGPANLRKSYITTAPNSYIPLDATSIAQKGLRPVFEMNSQIGA